MRAMSRGSKLLVLLLSFTLFIAAACGSDDNESEEGKSAEDTVPEADVPEGGEITYASDQEPTGWNPSTGNDSMTLPREDSGRAELKSPRSVTAVSSMPTPATGVTVIPSSLPERTVS